MRQQRVRLDPDAPTNREGHHVFYVTIALSDKAVHSNGGVERTEAALNALMNKANLSCSVAYGGFNPVVPVTRKRCSFNQTCVLPAGHKGEHKPGKV